MSADHPTVSVEIDFTTDLSSGVGYHEQVATSGPFVHYRLKETSGTFADASGNGKTGTGAGTITYNQTTTPVTGDATNRNVNFTTDTTRIGLTGAVPTAGRLTVEAFIYVTSLAVDRVIFENDGTGGTFGDSLLKFWVETDGALSAVAGNASATVTGSAGEILVNTWYHVVAVFDAPAREVRFYKNGVLEHTGVWETSRLSAASMSQLNTAWHWGTDNSTSQGSIARLAEPAVFLRALSPAEITDHYGALTTTPFAGYTWTNVTPDVLFGEGLRRSFGRASELDDVVPMQTEFVLRNDERVYEPEYLGVYNAVTNPSLETNGNGYSNLGTANGNWINGISTEGAGGDAWFVRHTATVLAVGDGVRIVKADGNRIPVVPDTEWTASLHIGRGGSGATPAVGKLQILEYNAAGSLIQTTDGTPATPPTISGATIPAAGRRSLSVTTQSATATVALQYVISTAGNGVGENNYIDDVMLSPGPLRDYFDGSTAGAHWEGTAEASVSRIGVNHSPNVVPGRPCRVRMTQNAVTYDWAFGFIEDWPQHWDSAGKFCRVPIRATCFLERLNEEDIGTRDFPEQEAGERLVVLLNVAGHPTSMRDLDAGANTLMALVADTQTVGVHARAIARTDRGLFYMDQRGYATFHDEDHRTTDSRSTASQGTLGSTGEAGEIPYSTPQFHAPRDRIRNEITLRRPGGIDQIATDQSSRHAYGKRSYSDELLLTTDALIAARAADFLAAFKDPHRRIKAITFNPARDTGYWEHALGVQLSDRYTWIFRPEQGSSVTTPVFVEGITDEYRDKVYTATWFLSVV